MFNFNSYGQIDFGGLGAAAVLIPKPGAGEVLLRIAAARICGTDVHIVQDEFVTEPRVTMGHELAGRISELCPGVTGWQVGDCVAVASPGPIGQLAALVAKAAGARVLLVGASGDEARLAVARRLGIDTAVSVDDNLKAAALEVLGEDGADLVIECSGAAPAAAALLELVRKGGRYCQVGLYGKPIPLDLDVVCYKELVVTGTNATVPSAWPRALRLLADGLPAGKLVTHRFSLNDWDEALATVRSKAGVKVVLVPGA